MLRLSGTTRMVPESKESVKLLHRNLGFRFFEESGTALQSHYSPILCQATSQFLQDKFPIKLSSDVVNLGV